MPKKQYGSADSYEQKLERVVARLEAQDYSYNWDRFGAWIELRYKGELYRFEHSIEKSKSRTAINKRVKIMKTGSDCFAKLVLTLERLALMAEDGVYELSTWLAGMKFLPPVKEIPSFFQYLGFTEIPASIEDVRDRYRNLCKTMHPDAGGNPEDFMKLQTATAQALRYFE